MSDSSSVSSVGSVDKEIIKEKIRTRMNKILCSWNFESGNTLSQSIIDFQNKKDKENELFISDLGKGFKKCFVQYQEDFIRKDPDRKIRTDKFLGHFNNILENWEDTKRKLTGHNDIISAFERMFNKTCDFLEENMQVDLPAPMESMKTARKNILNIVSSWRGKDRFNELLNAVADESARQEIIQNALVEIDLLEEPARMNLSTTYFVGLLFEELQNLELTKIAREQLTTEAIKKTENEQKILKESKVRAEQKVDQMIGEGTSIFQKMARLKETSEKMSKCGIKRSCFPLCEEAKENVIHVPAQELLLGWQTQVKEIITQANGFCFKKFSTIITSIDLVTSLKVFNDAIAADNSDITIPITACYKALLAQKHRIRNTLKDQTEQLFVANKKMFLEELYGNLEKYINPLSFSSNVSNLYCETMINNKIKLTELAAEYYEFLVQSHSNKLDDNIIQQDCKRQDYYLDYLHKIALTSENEIEYIKNDMRKINELEQNGNNLQTLLLNKYKICRDEQQIKRCELEIQKQKARKELEDNTNDDLNNLKLECWLGEGFNLRYDLGSSKYTFEKEKFIHDLLDKISIMDDSSCLQEYYQNKLDMMTKVKSVIPAIQMFNEIFGGDDKEPDYNKRIEFLKVGLGTIDSELPSYEDSLYKQLIQNSINRLENSLDKASKKQTGTVKKVRRSTTGSLLPVEGMDNTPKPLVSTIKTSSSIDTKPDAIPKEEKTKKSRLSVDSLLSLVGITNTKSSSSSKESTGPMPLRFTVIGSPPAALSNGKERKTRNPTRSSSRSSKSPSPLAAEPMIVFSTHSTSSSSSSSSTQPKRQPTPAVKW